jgi:hypothetical protein
MTSRGSHTCRCAALLESQDALLDHLAWCAGSAADNARLIQEAVARAGNVSYEVLVAIARQHYGNREETA